MLKLLKATLSASVVLGCAVGLMLFTCACGNASRSMITSKAEPSEYSSELNRTMYGSSVRVEVHCWGGGSIGTGFAISPIHVVTARHVTDCANGRAPELILVIRRDGVSVKVEIESFADNDVDAVRLRSSAMASPPFDVWAGTSDRVPLVGEEVCVVAGGQQGTFGIKKCGAVAWIEGGYFIVSMHIVPGNSGAAVFDSTGRVVGLVKAASFESNREYFGVMVKTEAWPSLRSFSAPEQE